MPDAQAGGPAGQVDGRQHESCPCSRVRSGHEALAAFLAERGVQTLICGGIGSGAVQALDAAGIQVYGGITGLADYAVEALLRRAAGMALLF